MIVRDKNSEGQLHPRLPFCFRVFKSFVSGVPVAVFVRQEYNQIGRRNKTAGKESA